MPTIISISSFEDLQRHSGELNSNHPNSNGYILDLSCYTNFIRPLFVVTIAQFVRYYRNRGFSFINIVLDSNTENQSSNYLKSIDFENRFNNNFESSIEFRFPNSSLPITTVTAADIENKQLEITRFLERKGIEKDFTAIQVCLAEILNNCFDHANSETGVIVHAQYFRSTHTIWLAVCDTGVGLPICVNNYLASKGLSTISSEEAIRWAFTNTNTTQSTPSNKGLGLNNVLDQTKANRGALRMITHDKWVLQTDRIDLRMRDTKHFFGTAIEIEINIDRLDPIDLADFSYYE